MWIVYARDVLQLLRQQLRLRARHRRIQSLARVASCRNISYERES